MKTFKVGDIRFSVNHVGPSVTSILIDIYIKSVSVQKGPRSKITTFHCGYRCSCSCVVRIVTAIVIVTITVVEGVHVAVVNYVYVRVAVAICRTIALLTCLPRSINRYLH